MNKKFVWTIKHTIGFCLFNLLFLIIALILDNDTLLHYFVSLMFCSTGISIAHIIRIKSGIKDNELPLSNKQMLFIFSLLALLILAIIGIKSFIADKSLSIILICSLSIASGIFALLYVIKTIKKNKNRC